MSLVELLISIITLCLIFGVWLLFGVVTQLSTLEQLLRFHNIASNSDDLERQLKTLESMERTLNEKLGAMVERIESIDFNVSRIESDLSSAASDISQIEKNTTPRSYIDPSL